MLWRSMSAWCIVIGSSGCSPTFDWREVRPEGSGVYALFPCKPASHAREVALAGTAVKLTMHACRAGDAVFALAFADVRDPLRVAPALAELREAAVGNIGATRTEARPLAIECMTPNAQAGYSSLQGYHPDGAAVREEVALFAHGTVVYQATVLGKVLDTNAVQAFVESLRIVK